MAVYCYGWMSKKRMVKPKNQEMDWKDFYGEIEGNSDAIVDLIALLQINYWLPIVIP